MNPDTKEDKCVGCGKPWKGNSLYCPECQRHNVGTTEAGLGGLVATYKPASEVQNAKYVDDCHKCGSKNTVTAKGWFCTECIALMSYNNFLRKFGDI